MNEIKQKIREYGKKIGMDSRELEKFLSEAAHTYQQLVDLEQQIFATKWQETKTSLQKVNKVKNDLKIGLIASLIVIILLLGGLGYSMLKRKKGNKIN